MGACNADRQSTEAIYEIIGTLWEVLGHENLPSPLVEVKSGQCNSASYL